MRKICKADVAAIHGDNTAMDVAVRTMLAHSPSLDHLTKDGNTVTDRTEIEKVKAFLVNHTGVAVTAEAGRGTAAQKAQAVGVFVTGTLCEHCECFGQGRFCKLGCSMRFAQSGEGL